MFDRVCTWLHLYLVVFSGIPSAHPEVT